jgi:8-hydroxy-5-deazaflavin:NADPH oxidoreductase
MTTAIIGVGNLGSAVARLLVAGDEPVVLAAKDASHAEGLAKQVGRLARAASVDYAIATADVVVLAIWLDDMKNVIPQDASLLEGKVIVDPSNPFGFDAGEQIIRTLPDDQSAGSIVASLLPGGAHYVKAFGTLSAEMLAGNANRTPHRAVLYYCTDDDEAAATAERLIRAAGFEPFKVGGVSAAVRIEMPGGDIHQHDANGEVFDLDRARAAIDPKEVPA